MVVNSQRVLKCTRFFVRMGSTLQDNEGQKHREKDVERERNKEERTVIHKNLPAALQLTPKS